ncbi:MAG TPA: DUF4038 domain-containing protein [Actinopolymorphaceae bacterium]|nr:DUF4038 domain-containing protein [Actinopolymorphaceae bacterium]
MSDQGTRGGGAATSPLTVAASADHFVAGGSPYVLCADTVWSAFAEAQPHEWEAYLDRRRGQGFNTLLISVLPILHDRSVHPDTREPYPLHDGRYDFSTPDEAYFENARRMVETATDRGFRAALVALWCTYVPGTWGSDRNPHAVMSTDETGGYLELLTRTFAAYDPIYVVSGDDRFATPEAVERYAWALGRLAALAPDSLTTFHSTPDTDLPAELADAPRLGFYSYQSGHDHRAQERTHELAVLYRGKPVRRPVANLEPCYEGHGYGQGLGRFTRFDVRRAVWWSLLAGAAAGVGYGAHGMWGWHRPTGTFTSSAFSSEPFSWDVALGFEGAWDVGFARALVEDNALYLLDPRQDLLTAAPPGVRLGATTAMDTVAAYVPYAADVELALDPAGYRVTAWNLATRARVSARLRTSGNGMVLGQPGYNADTLYVLTR